MSPHATPARCTAGMSRPRTSGPDREHGGYCRGSLLFLTVLTALFSATSPSWGKDDVYQRPSAFIKETFGGTIPAAGAFTLSKANQAAIKKLIGHPYSARRIRYWSDAGRTVWILNEIGKTKPITSGYVAKDGKIERVKVLIYRESHGWEVRQKFFTKQFDDAKLISGNKLDKQIDNIVGATLSARALTRMAKLALYLEQERKLKATQ